MDKPGYVILSWLNIKPGYVWWLSFLIAPDGIITNKIIMLIIIKWVFLDIFIRFFYYIIFCCLYYIFVYFIIDCNFISHRNFFIFLPVLQYFFLYLKGTPKLHETCFKYMNGNFHFTVDTFRLINKECLSVINYVIILIRNLLKK